MNNFSQIGGLLESNNEQNNIAMEQLDRINNLKQQKDQEEQQMKDSFASAGELLGGGMFEKSAESLIKKGIKYSKNKLNKLGLNPEEFEQMANDYGKTGVKGLMAGIIKRGKIKTQDQLGSYINNLKSKFEDSIPSTSSNYTLDEFGLPKIKADLPPDAPIMRDTLVKGGDDFRQSRVLDPDFQLGKYKLKSEGGQFSIVNRETGNRASDSEIRGYDEAQLNRYKKTYGTNEFKEASDPLETVSRDPQGLQNLRARFDSYGLSNDAIEQPLTSDVFKFTRPIPLPKPKLPQVSEDLNRYGVGDAENIPSNFTSSKYLQDVKSTRDYGKNISKIFMQSKQDESRLNSINNRVSDLKMRKSNLDSDSLRSIYKEKLRSQPKVKNKNGNIDVDSYDKQISYRENAMNNVEKLQGIARESQSSVDLGIVKNPILQSENFNELFPPPLSIKEPSIQSSIEPDSITMGDISTFKNIDDFSTPNYGSQSGVFKNVSTMISQPETTDLKLPSISNETPQDLNISSSDVEQAGLKALSRGGEVDLDLGGPEDPVGDIISGIVGVGTLVGSLLGDKPKSQPLPQAPPQLRTTFQIGQDV